MKQLLSWLRADKKRCWALVALAAGALLLAAGFAPKATPTAATGEELRLAQVLSTIEGAGRVDVVIQYAAAEVAAWNGGGAPSQPVGAIVVAEGGGDVGVRMALIRAVRTLLSLPEAAVDVFVREGTP